MGVHDTDKYGAIKEMLGIPSDEPIFIIRGQDVVAPLAIEAYRVFYNLLAREQGVETDRRKFFSDHLLSCISGMQRFQVRRPSVVKIPD